MVKKLIQGILKKDDSKKEDVPDELPPIKGEDDSKSGDKPEQKQEQQQQEAQQDQPQSQNEEAPAELPDIKESEAPQQAAPAPEAQPEPAPEPQQQERAQHQQMQPQQEEAAVQQAPEPRQEQTPHEGFFSKLSHLLKSGKSSDAVMKQNLLSTMKESYTIKREANKTGLNMTEEKRVKQTIDEIMGTLKLLEGKWRAQKMVIDEDNRTLKEYEDKIRDNEKKLKKTLRQFKLYQSPPEVLVLKNYLETRNISELYNALRTLDDKTYLAHVSKTKNDFADFVKPLDKQLAMQLKSAKSKTGMLRTLEIYIAKHKE